MEKPAEAVAAPAHRGIPSSSSLMLPPEFIEDPSSFLTSISVETPSMKELRKLAGPVASWFQSPASSEAAAAQVSSLYLKAAATQLRFETAPVGAAAAEARKAIRGGRLEELERLHLQQKAEVLEAVGVAATRCLANRISISISGIIPTLAQIMLNSPPNELQLASIEFLQCCLLAEQYRYASRLLQGTWLRPSEGSSVKQVLRYYYLRGMIHLGCNDLTMSHRCFWACLSIPSDSLSKITFEAWKKMILVQCLMSSTGGEIRTPKSMPNCMVRLLGNYKDGTSKPNQFSRSVTRGGGEPESSSRSSQRSRMDQQGAQEAVAAYMGLVDAFQKRDKVRFETVLTEKESTFGEDRNLGLIRQCLTRLVRHQVVHLSNMYSVAPISKVVSILGLVDESNVATVLLDSKVPCEIQDDGMVVFASSPPPSTAKTDPSLVDFSEWMELLEKVQQLDIAMVTSPKYHSLMQKEAANRKDAPQFGGPRGVEDL